MAIYRPLTLEEIKEASQLVSKGQVAEKCSLNELAKRAGVAQSMAYRVQKGTIRVMTPNVRRLLLYVRIAIGQVDGQDRDALDDAVKGYMSVGGTIEELIAIITACKLVRGAT